MLFSIVFPMERPLPICHLGMCWAALWVEPWENIIITQAPFE